MRTRWRSEHKTSMSDRKPYLRADLDRLPAYTPAHVPDPRRVIKLDSNENHYGPSPRVRAALAAADTWQYYFGQDELRAELAAYAGVRPENIVITNGGDESIDLTLRAALEPGAVVLDAPPSFEMYRILALANRARVVEVPRGERFALDTDAVCRAAAAENARVIALASPNNPDGGLLPRQELVRLLELPALVLLDEAYYEFSGETAVDLLPTHHNLALVRTFSKWAGLAGLRIGYVIASPEFAGGLHRLRAPYNVNLAALIAARESLRDVDYLMANVRASNAERERVRGALLELGWLDPLPSATNFLLVKVSGRAPQDVRRALLERGIMIRAYSSAVLQDYVRFSIGTPAMNDAVLTALREL